MNKTKMLESQNVFYFHEKLMKYFHEKLVYRFINFWKEKKSQMNVFPIILQNNFKQRMYPIIAHKMWLRFSLPS